MRGWATLAAVLAVACAPGQHAASDKRVELDRMIEEVKEEYPDVATITAAELQRRMGTEEIVLVDVRTPEERSVSTLPGALSSDEFEARLAELSDATVVVYCTVGARSSRYAREMGEGGIRVLNLEGSALAWTHLGGPLVSDSGPTSTLHVYGRRWDLAGEGYRTVW